MHWTSSGILIDNVEEALVRMDVGELERVKINLNGIKLEKRRSRSETTRDGVTREEKDPLHATTVEH